MSYQREITTLKTINRGLMLLLFGISTLLLFSVYGLTQANRGVVVHVPPDLSRGVTLRAGEISKHDAYAFALYMFQHLYNWPRSGQQDYKEKIFQLGAMLTPNYQAELKRDYRFRVNRSGVNELYGRTRTVQPLAGAVYDVDRVTEIDPGNVWVVILDLRITETVGDLEVKDAKVRYPVRVVRYEVDREANPWGMALDGYEGEPRRLGEEELAREDGEDPQ